MSCSLIYLFRDQTSINKTLTKDLRSFLVLFAHGTWPEEIEDFTVVADGKGEEKCELGKLNPSRSVLFPLRKYTVMFTSKALYYDLKDSCLGGDGDIRLMIKSSSRKVEETLRETTAIRGIPNQRIRKMQETETASPNRSHRKVEKDKSLVLSSSKKRKKSNDDAATPETDLSSRGTSTSRRLRLSENLKKQDIGRDSVGPRNVCHWPDTLILVGGQGANQVISKDALWELNSVDLSWKVPEVEHIPSRPDLRTGHTVAYDEILKLVYVFGGSKNVRWYNDLFVLDVTKNKWSLIETTGKAPTRAYHTSTLFRGELFVFGGIYPNPNLEPDSCSNDLYIFSSVNKSWYEPLVFGSKPKARSGHSATLLGDKLVIFGGWDAPVCFNDVHILDLGLMEFSSPDVSGAPPSPRSWHAACPLSDNRVLIHGGYNGYQALSDAFVFSLDSLSWQQVTLNGTGPLGVRAGHILCSVSDNPDDQESEKILMFGGGDNEDNFFNDLHRVTITES
ncbi:hypothetical protein BSL78_14689 [Apostichopus japonicus]|uniref:Uncharacterized protein n=1 Tax=Stichopus japonicus TaxID=307972 RepID=A0A2G8KKA2_STIJA|nr:hypothetical protein BSL78_14689 [Apostichopus japonicus]